VRTKLEITGSGHVSDYLLVLVTNDVHSPAPAAAIYTAATAGFVASQVFVARHIEQVVM